MRTYTHTFQKVSYASLFFPLRRHSFSDPNVGGGNSGSGTACLSITARPIADRVYSIQLCLHIYVRILCVYSICELCCAFVFQA